MGRLTNAFHASFHHVIVSQISEIGDISLGLPSGFANNYLTAVQTEQDIVNRTMGSAKTEALREQDELRDKYFRSVRNALRNARYSSDASIADLYDLIYKKLIKPYPSSIVSESDHTESSHLRGFVVDIKKYLSETQQEKLGIKNDMAAMETANEAFETIYLERVDEYVQNPAGYGAMCREAVDKFWNQLVRTLNFYANETGNSDGSIKMIAEEAANYVENLNKHISEFLKSVAASGNTGSKENTGTSTEKPGTSTEKPSGNTNTGGNSGTSGGNSGTSGGSTEKPSTNTGGNSGTGGTSGTSGGYNNDL